MPLYGADSFLGWMDNWRRVAARNVKDLVEDPKNALLKTADNMGETIIKHFQDPMNFVGAGMAGTMSRSVFLAKNPEFANTIFKTEDGLIKELYHGTSKDKDFKTFARNKRGNFVGEDPKEASSYALQNDSMGYTQDGYKLTPKNIASQVKPVFVNVQSPYYLEGEELVAYVRSSNYAKTQREIMDRAKALGHDAVIYPDGGIAVKDPSQIKSSLTGD